MMMKRMLAEYLYYTKYSLQSSWDWATGKKGSNPFFVYNDPKRKWRESRGYFRLACYCISRLLRLACQKSGIEERGNDNG